MLNIEDTCEKNNGTFSVVRCIGVIALGAYILARAPPPSCMQTYASHLASSCAHCGDDPIPCTWYNYFTFFPQSPRQWLVADIEGKGGQKRPQVPSSRQILSRSSGPKAKYTIFYWGIHLFACASIFLCTCSYENSYKCSQVFVEYTCIF